MKVSASTEGSVMAPVPLLAEGLQTVGRSRGAAASGELREREGRGGGASLAWSAPLRCCGPFGSRRKAQLPEVFENLGRVHHIGIFVMEIEQVDLVGEQ